MTSTYDQPGTGPHAEQPQPHWTGRERRRAERLDVSTPGGPPEHVDAVSTASTAATAYDAATLDPADLARLLALIDTFGLDRSNVAPMFHVGRTRRGYVLMLTEYDVDELGERVHVLGVPVVRHHLQPVGVDELPAACRVGR